MMTQAGNVVCRESMTNEEEDGGGKVAKKLFSHKVTKPQREKNSFFFVLSLRSACFYLRLQVKY